MWTNLLNARQVYYWERKKIKCCIYSSKCNATAKVEQADILDKALPVEKHEPHEYRTYRDGSWWRRVQNCCWWFWGPLGTSNKKHKMSAVYWVIANVASNYRSTLHSASDLKEYGYAKILHPLIQDLLSLEQHGVYVEKLGACIKGTVLYVAADNLAAHSLTGFFESFAVDRFCRFCMAKRSQIQEKEVCSGPFEPWTKDTQNRTLVNLAHCVTECYFAMFDLN